MINSVTISFWGMKLLHGVGWLTGLTTEAEMDITLGLLLYYHYHQHHHQQQECVCQLLSRTSVKSFNYHNKFHSTHYSTGLYCTLVNASKYYEKFANVEICRTCLYSQVSYESSFRNIRTSCLFLIWIYLSRFFQTDESKQLLSFCFRKATPISSVSKYGPYFKYFARTIHENLFISRS